MQPYPDHGKLTFQQPVGFAISVVRMATGSNKSGRPTPTRAQLQSLGVIAGDGFLQAGAGVGGGLSAAQSPLTVGLEPVLLVGTPEPEVCSRQDE